MPCVRTCNNKHYWQVYFDTNRLIRNRFTRAGFPVPEQHYAVRGGEELRLAKGAQVASEAQF